MAETISSKIRKAYIKGLREIVGAANEVPGGTIIDGHAATILSRARMDLSMMRIHYPDDFK